MAKSEKGYQFIEHTADIGVKAFGDDLKELFINSAGGMFAIIVDLSKVELKESIEIECEANNIEELLVDWLGELLYHFNTKEFLAKEFEIRQLEKNCLKAKVKGEKFDVKRHFLKSEIKGVTYHNLKVEKKNNFWQTEVIFDV
ncbi:MAG: archease [Candidatus Omnitrophica bacterium]|nr:archease [Candidatus Omnitrophota bacterium]